MILPEPCSLNIIKSIVTKFSKIRIILYTFSHNEMHLKLSSSKLGHLCKGQLTQCGPVTPYVVGDLGQQWPSTNASVLRSAGWFHSSSGLVHWSFNTILLNTSSRNLCPRKKLSIPPIQDRRPWGSQVLLTHWSLGFGSNFDCIIFKLI